MSERKINFLAKVLNFSNLVSLIYTPKNGKKENENNGMDSAILKLCVCCTLIFAVFQESSDSLPLLVYRI